MSAVLVTTIREATMKGSLLAATSWDKLRNPSERIWNLAVGEGLFGEFGETTTKFLRQRIDIGGFGRIWDELGDSGEFETGSGLSWFESD